MKRALLLFALVACRAASPTNTGGDIQVGRVAPAPLVTAPVAMCGPDHDDGLLEPDEIAGLRVHGICVRGVGDERRDQAKKLLRSEIGATFDKDKVRDEVTALFEQGHFRRVRVLARTLGDGVELTYDLESRPVVRAVDLDVPSDLPADDHLRELVGTFYDPADITQHLEWLAAHYAYEGKHTAALQGDGVRLQVVVRRR